MKMKITENNLKMSLNDESRMKDDSRMKKSPNDENDIKDTSKMKVTESNLIEKFADLKTSLNDENDIKDPLEAFDPMSEHYYSEDNSFVPGSRFGLIRNPKNNVSNSKKESTTLFVKNIPENMTENGLKNVFQIFGNVLFSCIRTSQAGCRFGLVDYKNIDIAMAAIHGLHLKPPYKLSIRFSGPSKNKTALSEKESSHNEVFPVISDVVYLEPKLPLILSDARKKFTQSELFKNVKNPYESHNKYILKLVNVPKVRSKKHILQQKKLSSLDNEKIKETFEINFNTYMKCEFCSEPASYYCNSYEKYYCSLYCQENALKRNNHKI